MWMRTLSNVWLVCSIWLCYCSVNDRGKTQTHMENIAIANLHESAWLVTVHVGFEINCVYLRSCQRLQHRL